MSLTSDFKQLAQACTAYEVIAASGASYVVFWFPDGSVCAPQKLPSGNNAAARLAFGATKPCLDDCGTTDFRGTTYQKGSEVFRQLST